MTPAELLAEIRKAIAEGQAFVAVIAEAVARIKGEE